MSCEISDRAQMSKTVIAVRHFGLGSHESNLKRLKSFTLRCVILTCQ